MHNHITTDKLSLHIKIDNENQIFSEYSFDGDNLNTELSECLIEKAERVKSLPKNENFKIQIHTNNYNLRLPEITRCIHRHFHNAYDLAKRKLHNLLRYTLVLFGLGILFLVAYYFAETYVDSLFLTEILDIATWVFVWAGVELIFLERHEIVRDCAVLRRLAFAEVSLSHDTKMDAPVYI